MSETVKIPIAEIKETIFVRAELDQDYVQYLASLYENDVKLPAIRVTRVSKELIDGRHRKAAQATLGQTEVECTLENSAPRPQLIARAFEANVGGPKPPTQADIDYTIELFLKERVAHAEIMRLLPFPKALVRRHLHNVQSRLAKARLRQAVAAVADGGLNVPSSAERFGVEVETLREAITGIKRKKSALGLDELKAGLTTKFKSHSMSISHIDRKLIDDYRDGEATEKHVRAALAHVTHLIRKMQRTHLEWAKRFDSVVTPGKIESTAKPQPPPTRQTKTSQREKKQPAGKTVLRKMGLA